jgi:hypothetical protein
MPGIKAKPGSVRTDMMRDETGVYHMRLQEKRPREVINIDSQDGNPPPPPNLHAMLIIDDRPTSKQKVSHPGQKSRFFALDTVAATPVPTPLEREAASRGLHPVPTNNESFANPYAKSADLPNRLADDFKKSNVSVVIPGNRWRGLTQPRHTGGIEVHLSWGMVNGEMEQNLFTRIGDEVKIYKSHALGERLATFKVSDADIVQVQAPESR